MAIKTSLFGPVILSGEDAKAFIRQFGLQAIHKRKLTGDHCQCAVCHEHFNSTAAFDKHRVWDAEKRRCLAPAEMTAKGMAVSSRGWWVTSASEMPANGPWYSVGARGG